MLHHVGPTNLAPGFTNALAWQQEIASEEDIAGQNFNRSTIEPQLAGFLSYHDSSCLLHAWYLVGGRPSRLGISRHKLTPIFGWVSPQGVGGDPPARFCVARRATCTLARSATVLSWWQADNAVSENESRDRISRIVE